MRIEDERLLTGRGCFTADVDVLGQLHAAFLRADRAHAEIRAIDTAAARAASGIHAVLTGEDVARAGLRGLPCVMSHADRGLRPFIAPHRPCLAQGRVRFVGEPVALIVADSLAAALDAAELVTVDYGELPAVVEPEQAAMAGAPAIWPEIPDNICFEWEVGDAAAVAEACRNAAHVVPLRVVNNRVVANPLEPRAVIATYDPARGDYNIRLGTQGMRIMRAQLATVLGVAEERVHVATADVGGAFGAKTPAYPEYGALLLAARQTGRPIKWVSTRAEAFLSEHHGRDSVMAGELMLDRDGGFLGLDVRFSAAMGAYLSSHGPLIATLNPSNGISGIYRIPTIHGRLRFRTGRASRRGGTSPPRTGSCAAAASPLSSRRRRRARMRRRASSSAATAASISMSARRPRGRGTRPRSRSSSPPVCACRRSRCGSSRAMRRAASPAARASDRAPWSPREAPSPGPQRRWSRAAGSLRPSGSKPTLRISASRMDASSSPAPIAPSPCANSWPTPSRRYARTSLLRSISRPPSRCLGPFQADATSPRSRSIPRREPLPSPPSSASTIAVP